MGHLLHMGEKRNEYKTLVKRPLARYGWEHNIKMELKETGDYRVDWIPKAHGRGSWQGPVAGFCEHGSKPSGSMKGKEFD